MVRDGKEMVRSPRQTKKKEIVLILYVYISWLFLRLLIYNGRGGHLAAAGCMKWLWSIEVVPANSTVG